MLLRLTAKKVKILVLGLLVASSFALSTPSSVSAQTQTTPGGGSGITQCGGDKTAYKPSIDLGCKGQGNAILDLTFAIIRFLSYGVGLVIVGSLTYAGIQYIGSRGDPNANALAVKRITSNVTALLMFIFAYALINYIVPGAVLK